MGISAKVSVGDRYPSKILADMVGHQICNNYGLLKLPGEATLRIWSLRV